MADSGCVGHIAVLNVEEPLALLIALIHAAQDCVRVRPKGNAHDRSQGTVRVRRSEMVSRVSSFCSTCTAGREVHVRIRSLGLIY